VPQQRVGALPFVHNQLDVGMDLSADATRGVVVIKHSTSDIWLIRNFGKVMQ
jgi:hypothetical protein